MSLIIAENLGLSFGAQVVLENMSFRIAEGDRIGLVGANGEGKTTLLKIIGGMLEQSTGDLHRRRGLRIGYLPQDPPALDGATIHAAMLEVFAELRQIEQSLHDIPAKMEGNAELVAEYGRLQHEFERRGGYTYQSRIAQVLEGLGFSREMWERPLSQLSGGQRTRVYLAKLLVEEPDLLLLDEPTNHLDIESTEWLESWLASFRGAFVIVSHDRYLLDRATTTTFEIAFRQLESYRGGYSKFLTLRAARHAERVRQWQAQQEYIAKTQEFIRIHMGSQRTNEAKGRRTRLERFMRDEAIERPLESKSINVSLKAGERTGDIVLTSRKLSAGYGSPIVRADELEVVRGDRIAIVGPNGSGKTTILRTLMGEIECIDGAVRHGANVNFGYLSQTHHEVSADTSAVDAVRSAAGEVTEVQARNLLGALLISNDDAFKRFGQLSGGQRSRVLLARLIVTNANVLMLDEPTNHLDIPSTEIIQDALKQFDGTVIFVSHDRYLVQALANHVWVVDKAQVKTMRGGWEKYLEWRDSQKSASRIAAKPVPQTAEGTVSPRVSKSKRKLDELESKIEKVEQELKNMDAAISSAAMAGSLDVVRDLGREHQSRSEYLHKLWEEWEGVVDTE